MSMITELVERLRTLADIVKDIADNSTDTVKTLREAADTIKVQSAKIHAYAMERSSAYYNGGWIPVSERLPKPYEQVLRTVKSIGWNGTFHIHVDLGSICPIDTDVIAWMPLPKPYEPQEREG